ncbi:DUF5389 family protein [Pasteurella atlantica]|uniref:DUF5389 family protein n=2 Tax=Pasteurellaceae TaxID=712 RepID=A0ACC6HN78_9PAST|nr:DUF5389 family protein [Pasteurella atlantica]MDP8032877.1 DUF5389 family protein [Pasteurella atlantica]MDP8034617.1 DUF5389 family protein [Pasteurella atlantica]MDP8036567.1 DUF5389 family protein [Pasteurella atlantica]MDP8047111.1 DUF5389 family protein [Pasteurella atlantica]MDP8049064.1 DUF5389 family protein [Pasteurella atlantica]
MNSSFSKFSWALGGLCLPCALWPLALLLTPALSNHIQFSSLQLNLLSISLWVYPFILFTIAYLLFKLYKTNVKLAKQLLLVAFIGAYGYWGYIFSLI